MAKSIRRRILENRVAALSAASVGGTTKPASLEVHRFLTRQVNHGSLPDQVVYPANEPTEERATSALDRRFRVRVLSRVKVTAGTTPDDALDELITWAEKAFGADETCGGLAFKTTPVGVAWDAEERHDEFAQAVSEFEIHYQTTRGDPESQA